MISSEIILYTHFDKILISLSRINRSIIQNSTQQASIIHIQPSCPENVIPMQSTKFNLNVPIIPLPEFLPFTCHTFTVSE